MRTRIMVIAAAVMLVIFGALGGLALASYAGTASAKDPDRPTGMPEACQNMDHEGMEQMHEGMHGTSEGMGQGDMEQMHEGMHQGMEGMHEGMMNADGQDGDSMQSGMPEMH